jgi:23S rRNA G2445 N2-methylase RlmL
MTQENNKKVFQLVATSPKGLELLLVDELRALGAMEPKEKLSSLIKPVCGRVLLIEFYYH